MTTFVGRVDPSGARVILGPVTGDSLDMAAMLKVRMFSALSIAVDEEGTLPVIANNVIDKNDNNSNNDYRFPVRRLAVCRDHLMNSFCSSLAFEKCSTFPLESLKECTCHTSHQVK
jgi:hypothetical protein